MNRKIILVIFLCFILGVSFACRPLGPENHSLHHEQKNRKMLNSNSRKGIYYIIEKLDLSKSQLKEMEMIKKEQFKKMRPIHEELREINFSLKKELAKQNLKKTKIDTLKNRILELQKEKLENHIKVLVRHREILTSKQFKKMEELIDEVEKERLKKSISKNCFFKKS